MTRDEVFDIIAEYFLMETPSRSSYEESVAVQSCLNEVQQIVIGTPSVVHYVAYLNLEQANTMLETLSTLGLSVIKNIVDYEAGLIDKEAAASVIEAFYTYQESILDKLSSVNYINNSSISFLSSIKSRLTEVAKIRNTQEINAVVASFPETIKGNSVVLPNSYTIEVNGDDYVLKYQTYTVDNQDFLIKNSTVVTNTDGKITITYPSLFATMSLVPRSSVYKNIVQNILTSSINVDTTISYVRRAILAYGIRNTNSTLFSLPNIEYNPSTIDAYLAIIQACDKWKCKFMVDLIHKEGFSFSNINNKNPSLALAEIVSTIGIFTDTRGVV